MASVSTPLGRVEAIPFPGRIVKVGDADRKTVKQIQHRLNEVGCGPIAEDGVFDKDRTEKAVKLFQSRFPDVTGVPLKIDGEVGSITWGSMFGASSVPSSTVAPSALTKAAIDFAMTQVGVREKPLGSNRGPVVDQYIKAVGLNPAGNPPGGFFWCVAFTHFCYMKAAEKVGIENPHIKTAGVLDHWQKAGAKPNVVRVTKAKAVADPGIVMPGSLFINRPWRRTWTFRDGYGSGEWQAQDRRRQHQRQWQPQRYWSFSARRSQDSRYQQRFY